MRKIFNIIFFSLLPSFLFADDIDVFGVDDARAQKIIKYYGKTVLSNQRTLFNARSSGIILDLKSRQKKLEQELIQRFHLPGVRFDNVYYPNQTFYTTIEVLTKLYQEESTPYQPHQPYDLIDKMVVFQDKAIKFYLQNPQLASEVKCLDFHCIAPEQSPLHSDMQYFRKNVPQQIKLIDKILFHDTYLIRQRAAIFLLTYYPNHQMLLQRLDALLDMDNRFIVHDALRVLGEYLIHYPHTNINIKKIAKCLRSDDLAVRHKTLIVLNVLADDEKNHFRLKKEAGFSLYPLLKLKQPNQHVLAYQILRKISQKNNADDDLAAWKKWLEKNA